MSDLADPWGAYERLQQKLSKKDRLDAEAWGFEAALNAIVEAVAAGATLADDEIERSAATAARGERYRTKLRLVFLQADEQTDGGAVIRAIEAREVVLQVADKVANDDQSLLRDLAEGHRYQTLARQRGVSAGSLRVRVMRVRAALTHGVA